MLKFVFSVCSLLFLSIPASSQSPPDDPIHRAAERRAVEAMIWGMPAVNTDLMFQAASRAGASENQIVYWSRLPSWKNQTLTPNPDSVYLMAFFNTKEAGPMVLEIPPAGGDGSITGNIDDIWQIALEDAGPAGADKGQGGKYLILPPGYDGTIPEGYIPLPSTSFRGYALLRSILSGGSEADVAKAVAYGRTTKLYPLYRASNPPDTTFVDVVDGVFDSTIPYDLSFFQSLDRVVQGEPWLQRDRAMIDRLRSIGIEKGKPFEPDARMQAILAAAAQETKTWLEASYDTAFAPYYESARWFVPGSPAVIEGQSDGYAKPDIYPTDERALTYSFGFVGIKHLGGGQFYLMSFKDGEGRLFDGGSSYRLAIPANVPVSQYWSATVYDRATHAFIREQERFSRSSQNPDLQKNADGSVDVFIGPKAPAGKEGNWIPTTPGGQFEVLFRLYGPRKPLFEKTWKLPDAEKIASVSSAPPRVAAQSSAIPVTAENFVRAETDLYFGNVVKRDGFGKFEHNRQALPIDRQTVIRTNRDTLYSGAVFDLDAGPATVTLPDAGKRFMSMQVIDEDQYTPMVVYRPGSHTLTRKQIGTRYVMLAVRTLVDPNDPKDVEQVAALQDAIKVSQKGAGSFEVPNWDQATQSKVRDALLTLASTLPDANRMFGTKEQVDPIRRLIGAASAWGGNPDKEAIYLNVIPPKNDGTTIYKLDVGPVPVDGFWSISLYNDKGYFQQNPYNAYSLNNITAKKSDDGTISVQFGGCDGKIANCLPTMPGWNYMVRLYRPQPEILNGTWTFPEAEPVL